MAIKKRDIERMRKRAIKLDEKKGRGKRDMWKGRNRGKRIYWRVDDGIVGLNWEGKVIGIRRHMAGNEKN